MSELKPCPFCGGEGVADGVIAYWVSCGNFCGGQTSSYTSKDSAVEAWNTRATPPELAEALAKIERVRELVVEGYPPVVGKHERCFHGVVGKNECTSCYDKALLTALGESQ